VLCLVLSYILGMIFFVYDFLFIFFNGVLTWLYQILSILIPHEILKYFSILMLACSSCKSQ